MPTTVAAAFASSPPQAKSSGCRPAPLDLPVPVDAAAEFVQMLLLEKPLAGDRQEEFKAAFVASSTSTQIAVVKALQAEGFDALPLLSALVSNADAAIGILQELGEHSAAFSDRARRALEFAAGNNKARFADFVEQIARYSPQAAAAAIELTSAVCDGDAAKIARAKAALQESTGGSDAYLLESLMWNVLFCVDGDALGRTGAAEALSYIAQSPTGAKVIADAIEKAPKIHIAGEDQRTRFNRRVNVIYWCPTKGSVMTDTPPDGSGRRQAMKSPALCLLHELAHAADPVIGHHAPSEPDADYPNGGERFATNIEQMVEAELGLPVRPAYGGRVTHSSVSVVTVTDHTEWKPAPPEDAEAAE